MNIQNGSAANKIMSTNTALIDFFTADGVGYNLTVKHTPFLDFPNYNNFNFLGCNGSAGNLGTCRTPMNATTNYPQLYWFMDYFETSKTDGSVLMETNGAFPIIIVPDNLAKPNMSQIYLYGQLIAQSGNAAWSKTWTAPVNPSSLNLTASISAGCINWYTPPKTGASSTLIIGTVNLFVLFVTVVLFL
jgi:hypothetical protein